MDDALRSPGSAARRQRIVEAAVSLFADAAYASVHMDSIAAAANVAKPTLYRYFPTKEVLFIEALKWTLDDLRAALVALRLEPLTSEQKLRRLVTLVLARIENLAPAIQAVESQNAAWGTESRRVLRQGFRTLRSEIADIVRDGQQDHQFAPVDADLASLMILGGIRMASHSRSGQGSALAEGMASLILDGLRGLPPSAPPSRLNPTRSGVVA